MKEISHKTNKDGNVEINATINNNTYAAIITPHVIEGKAYIKKDSIDTYGLDNEQEIREEIISYLTTHRGNNLEMPLVILDD